ncbi:MAG: hypothetical protein FD180_3866 [Planctomycetota bacterium]|nr:MAG: hypothetical protein FD180_3866 [Planctomycetota bacterium]
MKPLRPALSRCYHALPTVLSAGTGFCALLHVTVRDRWPVFSMAVYASPPVVMALVLLVASALWVFRRAWRPAIASGGGALLAVAWWLSTSIVLAPPADGPAPRGLLRGLGWNLQRGKQSWEAVIERIREHDPDVAWFVEAAEEGAPVSPRWHEALAGYDRREAAGGILFITKGRIRESRQWLEGRSSVAEFRVTLRGADITVLVADIDGSPWRHRRAAFEVLDAAMAGAPPGPLLVGGDFNTPRNSAFFDAWRGPMTHAFEARGRGMDGTWPTPIPFLSIDHCWVNDRIDVWSCSLPANPASDHRPVFVGFEVGK